MDIQIEHVGGGGGLALLSFFVHYLRGVNSNLGGLIKPVTALQKEMGKLNVQIAVILTTQASDKEDIEALKRDIKYIQTHCTHSKVGKE